jgi:hypothetical protein
LASSRDTPSRTVISPSRVISSLIGWLALVAKRTSRLVRMPTSLRVGSTTGMPEMRWSAISLSASARLAAGPMVTGLTTMPDSNFLTLRTSSACWTGSRLRWMTPMPPAWAMAMASADSVTVSIAADTSGMPSSMVLVIRVRVSQSAGSTEDARGSSSTSSKVRASRICKGPPPGSRKWRRIIHGDARFSRTILNPQGSVAMRGVRRAVCAVMRRFASSAGSADPLL